MLTIIQAETPEEIDEARKIFREYEAWLGLDLCFQGFAEELKNLPGNYAENEGRLLLVLENGQLAGCIALRKFDEGICELKRLFVREEFRGKGLGKLLVEKIIADARLIGYKKMVLDTYPPKMKRAVELYKALGFRKIPAYYNNPFDGVLFMEADI